MKNANMTPATLACFSLASLMSVITLLTLWPLNEAYALDLTSPFLLETAQVVPAGIRVPRFSSVFMNVENRFGRFGKSEPLAQKMNKVVTWNDVVKNEKDPTKKLSIQALVKKAGLDPDGSPGSTTGQVNVSSEIKVPILAMGVTDRLTLAVAVPVLSLQSTVDTGFVHSGDGQSFMNTLYGTSPMEATTAANKMNNAIATRLNDYGYEALGPKSVSNVGDIQLVGKYSAYKDAVNQLSVKSVVVLPTGVKPNANALVDMPTGDGRLMLGAGVSFDRVFASNYRWNVFGDLIAQLPNDMVRRIPTEADNPVSPDKELLTRKLGEKVVAGTSLVRTFSGTGLSCGAGYTVQVMSGAKYSGKNNYDPERYQFLEDLTPTQILHSATLTAGFSTVEWYLHKKFVYPFQANFYYSHPIKGWNAPAGDVFSGELVMFF